MTGRVTKVMGEGGVHVHRLASPVSTQEDGIHKHLFFVNDRLVMSDLSGAHAHGVDSASNNVGQENEPRHKHTVSINTTDGVYGFETDEGTGHQHELQSQNTTLSGLHTHFLELGGEKYLSLLPGDLIAAIESAAQEDASLKNFKIQKSEDPMEMNFQLIKRLNKEDFKPVMKKAVFCSVVKALSRLADGLQVESLVLSRDRYFDIGVATRFVLDSGLGINGITERDDAYVFNVRAKDRFDESSLQRVRLTDGVEAVVGLLLDDEVQNQEGDTVEATLDELTDRNKDDEPVKTNTLKSRFDSLRASMLEDDAPVKKNDETPTTEDPAKPKVKSFINFKTDKVIEGTGAARVLQIADRLGITRKFVTVEAAQKRFIEFLTSTYEIKNAVYAETANNDETQTEKFLSFEVRGETLDAVLYSEEVSTSSWRKSLIIFFDDPEQLNKIFHTEIKNHEFGAYQIKQTMMGLVLYPIEVDKSDPPILDEKLLESLESDTKLFFSKEVEAFFNGDNAIKKKLPYKRGVLMYGPPGNGKTTFIKHFVTTFDAAYTIMCEPGDFSHDMGKYLAETLGKDARKIIVFEDVDAIAYSYQMRSAFLNFLDGAVGVHKTLFIATTNYPGALDEALLKRPSRFDQKYRIGLPDLTMRKKFLTKYFPELTPSELDTFGAKTEGYSGAYFKELFILKNMRKCSLATAIAQVHSQMSDIHKSVVGPTAESMEVLFTDELDVGQALGAYRINKMIADLAEKSMADEMLAAIDNAPKDSDEEDVEEETEDEGAEDGDDAETQKVSLFFNIAKADTEKRIVLGPVLVPENFDLQDDIISADEIEKAAHNYMIKLNFREDEDFLKTLGLNNKSKRGFMHTEFNRKIALIESYTAPVDFTIGEREIKAGTWVMAVKVFDDEVWSLVKANRITGFSIGGRSRSMPVDE